MLGLGLDILGDIGMAIGAAAKPSFSFRKFLLIGVPKTILVCLGAMFSFYGVFVSTWYVASRVTPDATQQMTATFLGTFGFFITLAILWGNRTGKKGSDKTEQEGSRERQGSRQ